MRQCWPALSVPCPPHHQPLHVKPWAANPAQEKLLASEEKVVELQQQLQRMRLEQETLAQRNALLERLLAMQQQAQQQTPTETGKRAAIEGQKDAWWLDKQMKVGLDDMRLQVLHKASFALDSSRQRACEPGSAAYATRAKQQISS